VPGTLLFLISNPSTESGSYSRISLNWLTVPSIIIGTPAKSNSSQHWITPSSPVA